MDNFIIALLVTLLPSCLKILILRWMGHEIGENVQIGMSVLNIRKIILKDGVRIQHFNYFKNLSKLTMMENSSIRGWSNWFTASKLNYVEDNKGFGCLTIGEGSSILRGHYFDIQESITIGKKTMIAGAKTVFYTHSVTPEMDFINKPIEIGDACYIASHCMLLPGATIGSCTFVGAGSVVTKNYQDKHYVLLAGNPAIVKKIYAEESYLFKNRRISLN